MGKQIGYIAKTRGVSDIHVVEAAATLAPSPDARRAARRHAGQRVQLQGTLSGIAYRTLSGRARAHVCLTDVIDEDGARVFARVWLPLGVALRAIAPETAGVVAFNAGVEEQLDGTYRLTRPNQFRRVAEA